MFEKLMNGLLTTLAPFFDWIFLILPGNKNIHTISDGLEILFCVLSQFNLLIHDSSYIKRQTLSGWGHKFSEFACLKYCNICNFFPIV